MASLTLTSQQLAKIEAIESLTPAEWAQLPPDKQKLYREILAAYYDLVADNKKNQKYAAYFAASMLAIMILFILFRSIGLANRRIEPMGRSKLMAIPVRITRAFRSVLIAKAPFLPSAGHSVVICAYFAVMGVLLFVNVTYWPRLFNWAHRLGWMAICNITFLTLLAMKNTPLAFLTAYSYEQINVLHQIAGYTTVICVILHAVVYICALDKADEFWLLTQWNQICGSIAGITMIIMAVTALLFRNKMYELFYLVHIASYVTIIAMAGLHRSIIDQKSLICIIVAGGLWLIDRTIRFLRISWNNSGNSAILTPLPCGGTRVVIRKTTLRAAAGRHVFLWIPDIHAMQTHPFTICSTDPLEFTIKARDGFTLDLHTFAKAHSGVPVRASVEGPYGTVPQFKYFDKVIIVAGGSGASFTLGIAADLVSKLRKSNIQIEVVWIMKHVGKPASSLLDIAYEASDKIPIPEQVCWFSKKLHLLSRSGQAVLKLFATSLETARRLSENDLLDMNGVADAKVDPGKLYPTQPLLPAENVTPDGCDIEMNGCGQRDNGNDWALSVDAGRPDLVRLIRSSITGSRRGDRIIVAACGPNSMIKTARTTVAECIGSVDRSIVFHAEQFGW